MFAFLYIISTLIVGGYTQELDQQFLIQTLSTAGSLYMTRDGNLVNNACNAHRFRINSNETLVTLDPANTNRPYFGPTYASGNATFQCNKVYRDPANNNFVYRSWAIGSANALQLQVTRGNSVFTAYFCGDLSNSTSQARAVYKATPGRGCKALFSNVGAGTPISLTAVALEDADPSATCTNFPQSTATSTTMTSEATAATSSNIISSNITSAPTTTTNPCPSSCTQLRTRTNCVAQPDVNISVGYCIADCATLCPREEQAPCSCFQTTTDSTCECSFTPGPLLLVGGMGVMTAADEHKPEPTT